jgi:hypothetical protein
MGRDTSQGRKAITRAVELMSLVSIAVTLPIGVVEFYIDRREVTLVPKRDNRR